MGCNNLMTEEYDKLIEKAMRGETCFLDPEIEREVRPEVEEAKELFERAVEETGRQELAEEQAAKDEASKEYQQKLQESTELRVGDEHQVLIKGFNVSRIDNEDTARVQALFPAIITQATKEMEFTGKLPGSEMDKDGKIWATVENWGVKEGKAVGRFNRHTPELTLGIEKGENELTPEEKDQLAQNQMDTQLHWNFHTIHNILFTDEDRVEVQRICDEATEKNPRWAAKISPYAAENAKEKRYDEVFCECGIKFMTEVKKTPEERTDLEKANPEMYNLLNDRLERLSRLSDFLGLKIQGGGENE